MNANPGSILFSLLAQFERPWQGVAREIFEAHRVRKRKGFKGTWHVYPPEEKKRPWSVVTFDPTPYEARIAMELSSTRGTCIPTVEIDKDAIEHHKNVGSTVPSGITFELRNRQRNAIVTHACKIAEAIKMSEVWLLQQVARPEMV